MDKHVLANTDTGEITPLIVVNKRKNKIRYPNNTWYAVNQIKEGELMKSNIAKSMYTTKGRVYHHLASIMEYGNFAPFLARHVAEELNITRQSVYKAKHDLVEDKLLVPAINTTTGIKGVIFPNVFVQKSEENPNILTMEEYKEAEK